MPESAAFERAAGELEQRTRLSRLEARGTLRLALKHIGIEAKGATKAQVRAVVDRILPKELEARGVADPRGVCMEIAMVIQDVEDSGPGRSAIEVFERFSRPLGERS